MFMHNYNNPPVGIKAKLSGLWYVTAPKVYVRLDNKYWGMIYVCDVNSLVSKVANYHIISVFVITNMVI